MWASAVANQPGILGQFIQVWGGVIERHTDRARNVLIHVIRWRASVEQRHARTPLQLAVDHFHGSRFRGLLETHRVRASGVERHWTKRERRRGGWRRRRRRRVDPAAQERRQILDALITDRLCEAWHQRPRTTILDGVANEPIASGLQQLRVANVHVRPADTALPVTAYAFTSEQGFAARQIATDRTFV